MRTNCHVEHVTNLLKGKIKIQLRQHENFSKEELLKERIIAYIAENLIEIDHVDPEAPNVYSIFHKKSGIRKFSDPFKNRLSEQGDMLRQANQKTQEIRTTQQKGWEGDTYEQICTKIIQAVEEIFRNNLQ